MGQLQEEQAYARWVWRPKRTKRLEVMVEHLHDLDCELYEGEMMHESVTQSVSIPIQVVLKTRIVARVTASGETTYESELYTAIEVGEDAELERQENDEDEVAF